MCSTGDELLRIVARLGSHASRRPLRGSLRLTLTRANQRAFGFAVGSEGMPVPISPKECGRVMAWLFLPNTKSVHAASSGRPSRLDPLRFEGMAAASRSRHQRSPRLLAGSAPWPTFDCIGSSTRASSDCGTERSSRALQVSLQIVHYTRKHNQRRGQIGRRLRDNHKSLSASDRFS